MILAELVPGLAPAAPEVPLRVDRINCEAAFHLLSSSIRLGAASDGQTLRIEHSLTIRLPRGARTIDAEAFVLRLWQIAQLRAVTLVTACDQASPGREDGR
jgi:hypothetical protein